VFDEKIQIEGLAQDLAVAILYADLRPKERYDYPDFEGFFRYEETRLENDWDEKAYSVLRKNPASAPEQIQAVDDPFPDQIAIAFEDLATRLPADQVLYRARIFEERTRKTRFEKHELGAPPPERAPAGRANRRGESILYLATNKSTALAEVRAWKGAAVALVPVRIKRDLLVVDLKRQRPLKSPFFVELLSWRLDLAVLLRRLGEDMSRPVMPHEAEVLYKPTQLLSSIIKSRGYDGFIYPSAMGSGSNIALFNQEDSEIMEASYLCIRRVAFFSEEIGDQDDLYEAGPYDLVLD
jgi:RES domain-containing protein